MERRKFIGDGRRSIEKRVVPIEIRQADDQPGHLVGHAAVFNRIAPPYFGWEEQVAPGAFADSIKSDDVVALFNHDANFILGANYSRTLTLSEDQRGLAFDITLPDSQTVRDLVLTPIQRGDLRGCSFSFEALEESWDYEGDTPLRTLSKMLIFDVGPVTFPWYTDTDVSARATERAREMRSARAAAASLNPIAAAARLRGLSLLEREMEVFG